MNKYFFKDVQKVNKQMKGCLPLVIMEVPIKTTMGYHFMPIRMAVVFKKNENQKITRVGKDIDNLEPLCIIAGM